MLETQEQDLSRRDKKEWTFRFDEPIPVIITGNSMPVGHFAQKYDQRNVPTDWYIPTYEKTLLVMTQPKETLLIITNKIH